MMIENLTIRDLTDSELLEVSGGQSRTPDANVRVDLNPGQCKNVTVGNHTQEICNTTVNSAKDTVKNAILGTIAVATVACFICGTIFWYNVDFLQNRVTPA